MSYNHIQILSSSQSYQFASSHPTFPFLHRHISLPLTFIIYCIQKRFSTVRPIWTLLHAEAFLHSSFFTNTFTNSSFLHAEAATNWLTFYTHRFFHKKSLDTQTLLHSGFLHTRIFNAQQVLHTDTSSTHRRFFTQLDFFKSHAFELRLLSTHARHKGNRTRMHISSSAHSATLRTLNARNAVCHDLLCSKKWIKLFYTMRAHVLQPRHKNYYMEEKHLVTKMASPKIAPCLHATTKDIWNIYWHRVHKCKIVGRLHIPAT